MHTWRRCTTTPSGGPRGLASCEYSGAASPPCPVHPNRPGCPAASSPAGFVGEPVSAWGMTTITTHHPPGIETTALHCPIVLEARVWNEAVSKPASSAGCEGRICASPLLAPGSSFWLWLQNSSLHRVFYVSLRLQISPFVKRHQSYWIRPHPPDLTVIWLPLERSCFN